MVKRVRSRPGSSEAPSARPTRPQRPDIVHTSLYLPTAFHDALREIAFEERVKIHDLVMEAIGAFLKRRGYAVDDPAGKR